MDATEFLEAIERDGDPKTYLYFTGSLEETSKALLSDVVPVTDLLVHDRNVRGTKRVNSTLTHFSERIAGPSEATIVDRVGRHVLTCMWRPSVR